MRIGVYYAPALSDPLWSAASAWLGRDPATGRTETQPDLPDIAAITADAARYGFHATLKPPMRLRAGIGFSDVRNRAEAVCREIPSFDLPPLAVADLHGFLALRETHHCPALQALADICVAALDDYRDPPDAAELARRRKSGLSPERESMLLRWGYPDVFATWQFHMTLTRRLVAVERTIYEPAAKTHFAAALSVNRRVEEVCLFAEEKPGEPFKLLERIQLKP